MDIIQIVNVNMHRIGYLAEHSGVLDMITGLYKEEGQTATSTGDFYEHQRIYIERSGIDW